MSIDAKYIARIIKVCRESNVRSLRMGDLEINFVPGDAAEVKVVAGEAVKPPTLEELKEIERSVQDNSVLDRADEELAHMQVENPVLFEQLLVERELEGRGDEREEITLDSGT